MYFSDDMPSTDSCDSSSQNIPTLVADKQMTLYFFFVERSKVNSLFPFSGLRISSRRVSPDSFILKCFAKSPIFSVACSVFDCGELVQLKKSKAISRNRINFIEQRCEKRQTKCPAFGGAFQFLVKFDYSPTTSKEKVVFTSL